jgi:ribosomal protein S18 acetylase RimI-like enzyme
MDTAEARLARQNVTSVALEVSAANDSAIAFYKGRGYETQRPLRRYYQDGSDAYRMEKVL